MGVMGIYYMLFFQGLCQEYQMYAMERNGREH